MRSSTAARALLALVLLGSLAVASRSGKVGSGVAWKRDDPPGLAAPSGRGPCAAVPRGPCAREPGMHTRLLLAGAAPMKLRGGGRAISAILARSSNAWDDSLSESSALDGGDGDDESSDDDDGDNNIDAGSISPGQRGLDEDADGPSSAHSDSPLSSTSGSGSTSDSSSSSRNGASDGGDGESEADSDETDLVSTSLSPARHKITTYTSCTGDLRHVLQLLRRSHRIIVVTGAGMSASCGIPTFRGQGQLYDSIAKEFGLKDGHEVWREYPPVDGPIKQYTTSRVHASEI